MQHKDTAKTLHLATTRASVHLLSAGAATAVLLLVVYTNSPCTQPASETSTAVRMYAYQVSKHAVAPPPRLMENSTLGSRGEDRTKGILKILEGSMTP